MNGTWGIQMALLVASLFNVLLFPDDPLVKDLEKASGHPLTRE